MTREEAIYTLEQMKTWSKDLSDDEIEALVIALKALDQEPKTGHWFIDERPESNRETICSNCEQPVFKYHKLDFDYRPKYCPNCGVRMKSEV